MLKRYTFLLLLFTVLAFEGYGQILTFDFAGLAGDEVSATSNFDADGLTSSTITRGTGITPSANTDRFGATGFATSATLVTSDNDYFEFKITPDAGKKFSVTSIVILFQRSGTGPKKFALRSSVDSYGADLGTEVTIDDVTNTTRTLTFTFSSSNNLGEVIFRLYGYGAEGGTGTGGPEGTGNDIVVNGTVEDNLTPAIAISPITVSAGNVNQDANNHVIYGFECAVTTANATLNSVTVTSAGNYAASDIKTNGFKLWYSADNIFNSGSDNNIKTIAAVGFGGSLAFAGLTQSISNLSSGYFFITADVAASATAGNTINISSTAFSNIVFASGNKSGTDPLAAGGAQTIQAAPALTVDPTTLAFGNIASGSTSGEQSYSLSGTNLTGAPGNITVTAPTGFQVSLTSGSGFASSITVPYASATLSSTTIYVIFSPSSTGSASGNITNSVTGATTKNVSVSGYGISAEPATQASAISFGSVTNNGFTVSWTAGSGTNSIVLIKSGSAVNSDPVDGTSYTANTAFTSGTQIGTGNYVVYNSNSNTVEVTGLSQGTTYHIAVYTFNGSAGAENYLTPGVIGSQLTTAPPAVLLLEENFNYTATTLLTANGWAAHSGTGTNNVTVGTPGLVFSNYGPISPGNGVSLAANGQDVNKTFATQSSGIVYAAFIVKVKSVTTADYFVHLKADNIATNDYRARVFVQPDGIGGIQFGLSLNSEAAEYTTASFVLNNNYLLVIKYEIVASSDDKVSLLVLSDGDVPQTEPAFSIANKTTTTSDINPGAFALRQGTSGNAVTVDIDAIRVSTGWFGANGALPVELTSFTARAAGNVVNLNWETATEVDNNGFDVERNSTGTWQKIGFVEGHGTANSPKYYTFTDKFVTGNKIQYRLRQVDNDGTFEYSNVVEVELAPTTFSLDQNYPNPFNPTTMIRFSLPTASVVTLNVYNTLGEKVVTLLNGAMESGYHQVPFDAANLPSGLYLYEIKAGEFSSIKKMLLMK